jgi:hypothetical protein
VRGFVFAQATLGALGGGNTQKMVKSLVEQATAFGADAIKDLSVDQGGEGAQGCRVAPWPVVVRRKGVGGKGAVSGAAGLGGGGVSVDWNMAGVQVPPSQVLPVERAAGPRSVAAGSAMAALASRVAGRHRDLVVQQPLQVRQDRLPDRLPGRCQQGRRGGFQGDPDALQHGERQRQRGHAEQQVLERDQAVPVLDAAVAVTGVPGQPLAPQRVGDAGPAL